MGQVFFEEPLNDEVVATYPYNTNTHERVLNAKDLFIGKVSRYHASHMCMRVDGSCDR